MILDAGNSNFTEEEKAEKILLNRAQSKYYTAVASWFCRTVLNDCAPQSVLDVGCGTGHLLDSFRKHLATNVATFYGVDINARLIRNAKKRFPNYIFDTADGLNLPYSDGTFDFVYTSTVLGHMQNPLDMLREMVRVTKPGGKVSALEQDFETAVLYPGEKQLTRSVLNAATDYWSDGWIARKLPSMFKRLGLKETTIDAFVRIDREFDKGFFGRIRDWIVDGGFPEDQADAWFSQLCAQATQDEFIFTRNFYSVVGIRLDQSYSDE